MPWSSPLIPEGGTGFAEFEQLSHFTSQTTNPGVFYRSPTNDPDVGFEVAIARTRVSEALGHVDIGFRMTQASGFIHCEFTRVRDASSQIVADMSGALSVRSQFTNANSTFWVSPEEGDGSVVYATIYSTDNYAIWSGVVTLFALSSVFRYEVALVKIEPADGGMVRLVAKRTA